MKTGMKTSVYINEDNKEALKELLRNNNKLTTSGIINNALEDYFNKYNFDTAELRSKRDYRVVRLRLHKVVVRLLVALKKNFSAKVVNELIMVLLIRELKEQTGRMKFPDRMYVGLDIINIWLNKLKKKADLHGLAEIE